ncbi:MAG: FecR domain-containing protein, partial [Chitinophagaceae bacterium]
MQQNIHDILAKYFSGHATSEEEQLVRSWVEQSEDNRAEFNLLEKLWNASGEETAIVFDTQKAWQAVDARIQSGAQQVTRKGLIRRMVAIAAAAAIILLAGLWWLNTDHVVMQTVVASEGVNEIRLEDGSIVYLRGGAELQYPTSFGKNERNVTLKGEAFFDIARDESKPFSIIAADAKVAVLGTSFLVNTKNNHVELVVKTGRVEFGGASDTSNKMIVMANERALLRNGQLDKEINTDPNFNAWQTRRIIFDNTPLSKVVA